jgi:hypothetical protein
VGLGSTISEKLGNHLPCQLTIAAQLSENGSKIEPYTILIMQVQYNDSTAGTDIPGDGVSHHCLLLLDDENVALIGGHQEYYYSTQTFFYVIKDQKWSRGPSLNFGRFAHSCAIFQSNYHGNKSVIVVSGGMSNHKGYYDYETTTEFLVIGAKHWTSGKKNPIFIQYFVTL